LYRALPRPTSVAARHEHDAAEQVAQGAVGKAEGQREMQQEHQQDGDAA